MSGHDARTERTDGNGNGVAARRHVVELVFGHMAAQTVSAAVRAGVFDHLGDGERTAAELAARCGTQPQATHRLLRCLTALRLLTESPGGGFRATQAGTLLREDVPGSVTSFVRMFTDQAMVASWARLDDSLRTGETSFDAVFGTDFFGYLKEQPKLSAEFNAAMSEGTRSTAADLPHHYDFGRFSTVVDVGGGDGTLLAAILRAHPGLRGVVYDTAEGLGQAPATLAREEVADRATTIAGDFFESVPADGDLYLLKSVIHDWDDATCAAILRRCREALPEHGRVLLIEPVLPEAVGETHPLAYLSDLNMLVNVGGRERTLDDFTELLRDAGFDTPAVTPLPAPNSFRVIEAAPRAG